MKLIERLGPLRYVAWIDSVKHATYSDSMPFEVTDDDGSIVLKMEANKVEDLPGDCIILQGNQQLPNVENVERMEEFCALRKVRYLASDDYLSTQVTK